MILAGLLLDTTYDAIGVSSSGITLAYSNIGRSRAEAFLMSRTDPSGGYNS